MLPSRKGAEEKVSSSTLPRLHKAMWPGLVGKGDGLGQEPLISLERMLELTAGAEVNGQKFDGIGVDTWGVDFGLLGAEGRRATQCHHQPQDIRV
jgi:hypothetical protein